MSWHQKRVRVAAVSTVHSRRFPLPGTSQPAPQVSSDERRVSASKQPLASFAGLLWKAYMTAWSPSVAPATLPDFSSTAEKLRALATRPTGLRTPSKKEKRQKESVQAHCRYCRVLCPFPCAGLQNPARVAVGSGTG